MVLGTTGSGKTTLAARLARRLEVPHIELDALNWGPGWTERAPETFRAMLLEATAGEGWVTDGNYGKARAVLWPRAQAVIWLDYPAPLIFARLFRRTCRRVFGRDELWNGNRETFRAAFLSRDSLFVWFFRTYARRRRELPALLARPEYAHLEVYRLRSPRETERWLRDLEGR